MKKINIAVIFGGVSSEYKISLMSAANVIRKIDTQKYKLYKLGISQNGAWFLTDAGPDDIEKDMWQDKNCVSAWILPDMQKSGILTKDGKEIKIDVCFPVLHGKNGEDGSVAALLQLAGIKQVTPSMTAGANSMDKALTKIICEKAGINQAKWAFYYSRDLEKKDKIIDDILSKFDLPVFIKPSSAGSSVGISKVSKKEELYDALLLAAKHDFKIIVEEFINGKEIEVAIMGKENPIVSTCGEIVSAADFYDFDAKYNDDNSLLFIPARIDEETIQKVRKAALDVYRAMECSGMSRIDFFVTENDVIFNELNTIPGFTNISMYPKLMEHAGFENEKLIDELIRNAIEGK